MFISLIEMLGGALVRIPPSLSRNGKVLTNLRGINSADPVDYIDPSGKITAQNIAQIQVQTIPTGIGDWKNSIVYTYGIPDPFDPFAERIINYPQLLSNTVSGILLFRMYVNEDQPPYEPEPSSFLFLNGTSDPNSGIFDGYAIEVTYDSIDINVNFLILSNKGNISTQLNTSGLSRLEWYHFGVKFDSQGSSIFVTPWFNGIQGSTSEYENTEIVEPTGGTFLYNNPFGGGSTGFYGGITDFVFIDGVDTLTDNEMSAFAIAPFV
jgi:hypothetical protein